jgi:hypothetical protein
MTRTKRRAGVLSILERANRPRFRDELLDRRHIRDGSDDVQSAGKLPAGCDGLWPSCIDLHDGHERSVATDRFLSAGPSGDWRSPRLSSARKVREATKGQ